MQQYLHVMTGLQVIDVLCSAPQACIDIHICMKLHLGLWAVHSFQVCGWQSRNLLTWEQNACILSLLCFELHGHLPMSKSLFSAGLVTAGSIAMPHTSSSSTRAV